MTLGPTRSRAPAAFAVVVVVVAVAGCGGGTSATHVAGVSAPTTTGSSTHKESFSGSGPPQTGSFSGSGTPRTGAKSTGTDNGTGTGNGTGNGNRSGSDAGGSGSTGSPPTATVQVDFGPEFFCINGCFRPPLSADFGTIELGRETTLAFSVPDGQYVTFAHAYVSGPDAADFALDDGDCTPGMASESGRCALRVKFIPGATGTRQATLVVEVGSTRSLSVGLHGVGGDPATPTGPASTTPAPTSTTPAPTSTTSAPTTTTSAPTSTTTTPLSTTTGPISTRAAGD